MVEPQRAERRSIVDRRRPMNPFSIRLRGRRRGFRRQGEGVSTYVDCVRPEILVLVLFLVLASGLDALLTLLHLENGADEANPVMHLALELGTSSFVALKMSLTAAGAMFLAVHQLFPLGKKSLRLLAIFYALVLVYHALLLELNA